MFFRSNTLEQLGKDSYLGFKLEKNRFRNLQEKLENRIYFQENLQTQIKWITKLQKWPVL